MDVDARFEELRALIEKERGRTEVLKAAVRSLIKNTRQSPRDLDAFLNVLAPDPSTITDDPLAKAFAEGTAEMLSTLRWEIDRA